MVTSSLTRHRGPSAGTLRSPADGDASSPASSTASSPAGSCGATTACVAFLVDRPDPTGPHARRADRARSTTGSTSTPTLAAHLMTVGQTIGRAQQAAFAPDRVGADHRRPRGAPHPPPPHPHRVRGRPRLRQGRPRRRRRRRSTTRPTRCAPALASAGHPGESAEPLAQSSVPWMADLRRGSSGSTALDEVGRCCGRCSPRCSPDACVELAGRGGHEEPPSASMSSFVGVEPLVPRRGGRITGIRSWMGADQSRWRRW